MSEFLKLLLTGGRIKSYKAFIAVYIVSAYAQFVFAAAVLLTASANMIAAIVLVCLLVVSALAYAVLSVVKDKFWEGLILSQSLANQTQFTGEELEARKSLTANIVEVYCTKSGAGFIALNVIPSVLYFFTAVFSALISTGVIGFAYLIPITFTVSIFSSFICTCISAGRQARKKSLVYDLCENEITLLKKNAGYGAARIKRQSRYARNFVTRSQELFLCDRADIDELRKIGFSSFVGGLITFCTALAAVIVTPALTDKLEETFLLVSMISIIAFCFAVFVFVQIRADILRRAIFARNAVKLSGSQPDLIRRTLQNEFMGLQRRGNITFAALSGGGALLGFLLGALSAINAPEINAVENAGGIALIFFVPFTIAAAVVWLIIYGAYRSKVRPLEKQLSEII